ncbi:hypothetical protein TNCV_586331 [Trichonephila clavipes]|nr:hypothetical protein TNCV_586331 [Trichonephila clavipes]
MNEKDESTSVVQVEALEMRPTTKSPRMLLGTNCGKANNAVAKGALAKISPGRIDLTGSSYCRNVSTDRNVTWSESNQDSFPTKTTLLAF